MNIYNIAGFILGLVIALIVIYMVHTIYHQYRVRHFYSKRKGEVIAAVRQMEQMGLEIDIDKLEAYARGRT